MKPGTRGVIIGKFMPPHAGHSYLIDFAAAFVDELWVMVCSLPHEPIPGTLRFAWVEEMFPRVRVIHIEEVNPLANRQQPGAQGIWAKAVQNRIGAPVDYVFASESYGWDFARELGARFIPVDPSRDQFPISGSELREKPFRHWHFLPKTVRPWFVKTVLVSCQSGTAEPLAVASRAAGLLSTLYVPPYHDFYAEFSEGRDLPPELIMKAEFAQLEALKAQARHFILIPSNNRTLWEGRYHLDLEADPEDPRAAHIIKDLILDHFKDLY